MQTQPTFLEMLTEAQDTALAIVVMAQNGTRILERVIDSALEGHDFEHGHRSLSRVEQGVGVNFGTSENTKFSKEHTVQTQTITVKVTLSTGHFYTASVTVPMSTKPQALAAIASDLMPAW